MSMSAQRIHCRPAGSLPHRDDGITPGGQALNPRLVVLGLAGEAGDEVAAACGSEMQQTRVRKVERL